MEISTWRDYGLGVVVDGGGVTVSQPPQSSRIRRHFGQLLMPDFSEVFGVPHASSVL